MIKKLILSIVIIVFLIGIIYQVILKEEEPVFTLVEAVVGDVFQEISETGTVRMAEEISLSFQNPGRIEKIYVKVGQEVKAGQDLARLETSQSEIQLAEAQAILELAQAKLNQLLTGASKEEIKLAETTVVSAEIALSNARQNLENVETETKNSLNETLEDGRVTLDIAFLKLESVFNVISTIQETYFIVSDQEGLRVREEKDEIKNALNNVKPLIEVVKGDLPSVGPALTEMKRSLTITANALKIIRDVCETLAYRDLVSSSDKAFLDAERRNINTALTHTINSQQIITSTKLTNKGNINTAQAKVDSAEGQLQSAKDTLAIKKAGARQVDINIYQAQIKQAQAKVNFLKKQLEELVLKSPIDGVVTQINKKAGETVQIIEPVISLISTNDFQIEVDVYEEDVVKVKIENSVDITLVAFPDRIFKGKVLSIDPTEKLIGGVVYYETTIGFIEEPSKEVRSGMTADVIIKTAFKENVLIISEDVIQEKNGKLIVQVFKDGQIEEREIETGLQGGDDMVEVISGLKEGEEVIVK